MNRVRIPLLLLWILSQTGRSTDQTHRYFGDGFLDTLQYRTFHYFWDLTDPRTGLTPDRAPTRTFSSTAAIGFALTAYGIGAERDFVSRTDAAKRVLTTLRFLASAPQGTDLLWCTGYKGFFYHFLSYDTGLRFGRMIELSTIDTALLLAGALFCQEYFDRDNAEEKEIRILVDSLYNRVDWRWSQARPPLISHGWDPEHKLLPYDWGGYNEAMILYILALGSTTHPATDDAWEGWTKGYRWAEYYGLEFVSFGPLFGHQYSHCWIDFRGIQDAYMKQKGIDYFENARRATYTQRSYALDNPRRWKGYSSDIWGFSACDGPGNITVTIDGEKRKLFGYGARGVSFDWVNDDGTITPTAPGGSVAFAPEICVPALKAMRNQYGALIWKEYGFLDSFNPTAPSSTPQQLGWSATDYLGIDQGPMIIMIENLRSGLVWEKIKKSKPIIRGLRKAGFTGGWLDSLK